jgi:outer membrane protein OmpA-like peptidoglycan-associated protein
MISAFSQQTGASESAVSKGFSAAIPAIATALANRSDDQGFLKNLAALATRTAASPDPLAAISGLVSTSSAIDTSTPAGGWLSSLFGRNLSAVTDSIARYSGLSGSSAASILSICAPLALRYIGRMMRSDNLTVSDLGDRLRAQPAQLASAVPAGFEMPAFLRAPVTTSQAAGDWMFPALALLSVLSLGGLIWWASQKPVQHARVEVIAPAEKAVGTAGSIVDRLSRSLPGNVNISIPAGSAEDRLSKYLMSSVSGGTTMEFDRISFDEGSAKLTAESAEQLDNIATILRAYPQATVTVSGHTDNVGNEQANRNLSTARAKAVANSLTSDGVEFNRVSAEGYGSQKPVANNSTEAGRAQNRRVTLEVVVR